MKNSVCSFVLMLLCVALFVTTALYGISDLGLKSVLDDDAINKGLDLVGGSSITYQAKPDENQDIDMATALETVEMMLRQRLDTLGYSEGTIARVGSDQLRIEIPGIDDPEEAVRTLGSTAKLEFRDYDGNVLFEGDAVKEAVASYGETGRGLGQEYFVSLTFTNEGRKLFADATENAAAKKDSDQNYIDIFLDEDNISHASVDERIDSDSCIISGNFTQDDAIMLAELISAGKLPVELEEIELRHVGATLGTNALSTSLKAGLIGIIIVMIFMILVYRLPGLVSAISLVAYIAIIAILLVAYRVNLSLPGIAGIILSIGMAVDSNVIIYERIKEELNAGKSVRAAVKAGFSNALSSIIDANITTIIAAAVLMYFGVGAVYGFAVTLLIGVLVSLVTALIITRVLLTSLANMGAGAWLMGAKCKKNND